MSKNLGRVRTQDDWKRTQVRMPQKLYQLIVNYGEKEDLSLNSAIIDLIENGLDIADMNTSAPNIRIYHLANGQKRVIFGKLVNSFDIDYTNENLTELKEDIEYCLDILCNTGSLKDKLMFLNKNVFVYQGGHHLDVVNDGKKSLHWLTIEDHYVPNT